MASRILGSKHQSCGHRIWSVPESRRRELMKLVLVLGEERDQVRTDDVVGGELEENSHGAAFEAVSCQHLRFWERLEKAEESAISHLLKERCFRGLLVEETQHMLQHFRILILLNNCPARDSEGIRARRLGLIPLDDDLVERRIVVDETLFREVEEIVEAAGGFVHQVNHHRENERVGLKSVTDEEDDLLASCWSCLVRRMKSSRCCQRRDKNVEQRSLNR